MNLYYFTNAMFATFSVVYSSASVYESSQLICIKLLTILVYGIKYIECID